MQKALRKTILKIFRGLLFSAVIVYSSVLSDGNKAFSEEKYEEALQYYLKAQVDMPESQLLQYNLGTCYYKLSKYDKSVEILKQSAMGDDSLISRNAMYNLGNTYYRMGQQEESPKNKISQYKESIAILKKSLDYDSEYEKAKRNIEYIQIKLKEELDKHKQEQDKQDQEQDKQKPPPPSDAAKEALAKALQLVKQGLYNDAKAVLEKVIQSDETASFLTSYVQKIQDVIDISNGIKPSSPVDDSNQANDLEVI